MKRNNIIVSVIFAAFATSAAAGSKKHAITRESPRGTSSKSSKQPHHSQTASETLHVRFVVPESSKEPYHSQTTSTLSELNEIETAMEVRFEDDCAFANPADRQAESLVKPTGLSFQYLISHAELVNVPYSRALDEWLVNEIDTQGLFDEGEALGKIHLEVFSGASDEEKFTQICAMKSALVSQMKHTCKYEEEKLALASVAVALIDGFAFGVGLEHVECEDTLLG